MLPVFITEIIVLGFICFYVKGKYEDFTETGFKKGHIYKVLAPAALFITDKLIAGRFIAYERKLGIKLAELYGGRDIKHMLKLHFVHKVIHMIIALLSVTLLGALMEKPDIIYAIFALSALGIVFYVSDRELDEKIKKRNFNIRYDFPDFLNKMVLLINAGMTVPRAWEKIVRDRKNITPLYEELRTTYIEIMNGKPEMEAYEDFAKRCRVKEITKFITAVIQNLKKGNSDLVPLLKLQSNECWQLRKNMAKKLGEEASTKLVLPLMIMFVGILIIVTLPAVMQLRYL
ncbi:MAG TPA: type II secretion system F family protein [Bacillota bacterium]|nr:type II secretion system F family protein [Clostridiaceae bacterium]HNR04139.1 type II secretion system F family protein [Bacillota bacterium]HNT02758.1 type II secretion system F family protein [Bacillota bacterium]HPA54018.1 type II secretion system F family protein [Bacillota bacterium]HPX69456.1 type II secretion system F family protein [Bacillota bacterium]